MAAASRGRGSAIGAESRGQAEPAAKLLGRHDGPLGKPRKVVDAPQEREIGGEAPALRIPEEVVLEADTDAAAQGDAQLIGGKLEAPQASRGPGRLLGEVPEQEAEMAGVELGRG